MSKGTIVITGASSGLGEEMARQFAARDYDLAVCARRLDRLEVLKKELTAEHPAIRVSIAALDVADEHAVPRVLGRLATECGRIDRVIVNAGVGTGAALGTGGQHANRSTAMANFVGALATADSAMEILRGMPRSMTTYAASKAGVAAIAEGLRPRTYRVSQSR